MLKPLRTNNNNERMRITTRANDSQKRERGVPGGTGPSLLALQVPTPSVKTCRRCIHQSFQYTFVKHYRKLLRKFFLCCFLQRAARCPTNADNARVMRSRSRALCRPLRRWRQYCYSTTQDTSILRRYNAKSIKATGTLIPAHHHHAHHATNCCRHHHAHHATSDKTSRWLQRQAIYTAEFQY